MLYSLWFTMSGIGYSWTEMKSFNCCSLRAHCGNSPIRN